MIDWLRKAGAKTAFIGGTGLNLSLQQAQSRSYAQIPNMSPTSTISHVGEIRVGYLGNHPLVFARGRVHPYETGRADEMDPIYDLLAKTGVKNVVISGAVGSMSHTLPPGQLGVVRDHIYLNGASPLTGRKNAFVEMNDAYVQDWGQSMPRVTYAWTNGPQLETPAEIRALKALGGEVVGMSMPPETILARFYGLRVFGLVAAVNWATGFGPSCSIDQMLAHASHASKQIPEVLEPLL